MTMIAERLPTGLKGRCIEGIRKPTVGGVSSLDMPLRRDHHGHTRRMRKHEHQWVSHVDTEQQFAWMHVWDL